MKQDALIQAVAAAEVGSPKETARALRELASPTVYTGTSAAGAITLNARVGKVTTEGLTTAQNAVYTLTITNDQVAATDVVLVSIANGTNTQGTPMLLRVTPAAGSVAVTIQNKHDTAQALNGTLVVSFAVYS